MNQGRPDTGPGEFVTIDPRQDGPGVTVVDRIERRRCPLATPDPVTPRPGDPDEFLYPLDAAVEVETSEFVLPNVIVTFVRDDEGEMLAKVESGDETSFPEGSHRIELNAAVKVYLQVEAPVRVASTDGHTRIEFDEETDVRIGARSHHDHPAATVTVPGDPASAMRAVSTFGSALKSLSPERSFPTLRGHPPAVEVGEELDVPPGLEPPESGVRIEVPRDLGAVYTVAPLAYYLGAEVVPGASPRLVTDRGFEYSLGPDLEVAVERTLKQTFLLDCATRTEGFYDVDLHERRVVEDAVDLDFAALYDAPIAERVETHLRIPHARLADHYPDWKLTACITPEAESVESLPFLVNDLGIVRTRPDPEPSDGVSADPDGESAIESFARGEDATAQSLVQPPDADSVELTWVGEGIPLGATKATPTAFRNRLDREPTDGSIDVTLVCNEESMREERAVVDYGRDDTLPFEVTVRNDLSREEFRQCLTGPGDFLHYVGHVDDGGFRCADGRLDATELDEVGVDAFLLNACHSYDQGMALIDAGAIAGIVTLDEVVNAGAVTVGETLARLLNDGFSLESAVEIVRESRSRGSQYLVVGDGRLALSQFPGGTPHVAVIEESGDEIALGIRMYPAPATKLGAMFTPYIPGHEQFHLDSGDLGLVEVTRSELDQFLSPQDIPVLLDGDLHWSEEVDLAEM